MVEWQRTTAAGVTRVEGYGFGYGLDLFSNFTYFLDDPENGDQFEQRDDRVVFGGRVSHAWPASLFGRRSLVTVGGDVRRDDIGEVGLYRTAARERLSTVREDTVVQTSGAAHVEVQTQWSDVVRTTVGLRGDLFGWDVEADDPINGGTASEGIVNPKLSVALGPWRRTELYASAGGGLPQQRRPRRDHPARSGQRRGRRAGRPSGSRARGGGRSADAGPAAAAHHLRRSGGSGSSRSCCSSATPGRRRRAGRAGGSEWSGTPTTARPRG